MVASTEQTIISACTAAMRDPLRAKLKKNRSYCDASVPILRVPVWLIYLLSLSTLTTGALPAFARVLIIVDKNTQQMSVSVDGVPRYPSQCQQAGRGTGRRTVPTIHSV